MKAVFFSDTHLNRTHKWKTRIVESFVREVCVGADMVFLLGDIFEFYHGQGDYMYPWFRGIADALKEVTMKGGAVYFIEGNHEFGMGAFFQSYTGAAVMDEMSVDLDGSKVFVSHGDAFAGGLVRAVLKSRVTSRVMDLLGPRLTWIIAMEARVVLSKKHKPYNIRAKERFREYADAKFDEGFDVVVLAHSHIPDRMESGEGEKRKIYLNTGDFIAHSTYVSYETSSGLETRRFSPKA
jgi:UDP-2,3-diacylglucosamine hydrolase